MLSIDQYNEENNIMMESKRISVSSKRQITIPKRFFDELSMGAEAECYIANNAIVITPIRQEKDSIFAEEILADLIKQGFTGEELLSKFKILNNKVRPAVLEMMREAENIAKKTKGSGDTKMEELFGEEG